MWGPDNKIYFASDRDGRMNLYSTDLATKETKQLTGFKDFDIKFPSMGKDSDRLRARRGHLSATTAGRQSGRAGADFHQGRPRRRTPGDRRCRRAPRKRQPRAGRQARHRRRARRTVLRARQGRHAAQSVQHLQRARTRRPMVARRQVDRLSLRRHRARASSTFARRTARASRSSSPRARTPITSRRSGRPTARNCSGATAWSACASWTWAPRPSRSWTTATWPKSVPTTGRPTASGSPGTARKRRAWRRSISTASTAASASRRRTAGTTRATRRSATTANISAHVRARLQSHLRHAEFLRGLPQHGARLSHHAGQGDSRSARPERATRSARPTKDKKAGRRQKARRRQAGRGRSPDDKKPASVTVDEDGLRERLTALNIPPGNYQALRMVDDRVFYLRAQDDDGGGDEDGPGDQKSEPVRLQPQGAQGNRARRGQRLRDHL